MEPIAESLADFLENGTMIRVAAASASLVPDIALAVACIVEPDRRRLRVALDSEYSEPVLALIAATAKVAVVYANPMSHRAVQVKSHHVKISPVPSGDWDMIADRMRVQNEQLAMLGLEDPIASTFNHYEPQRLVYLHLSIDEIYDQTPGPNAGKVLEAR